MSEDRAGDLWWPTIWYGWLLAAGLHVLFWLWSGVWMDLNTWFLLLALTPSEFAQAVGNWVNHGESWLGVAQMLNWFLDLPLLLGLIPVLVVAATILVVAMGLLLGLVDGTTGIWLRIRKR